MVKLRIMSDIHREFFPFELKKLPDDNETILIIAGDYWHGRKGLNYIIDHFCKRFKQVIRINGNHEFYFNNIDELRKKWKEIEVPNLISLDNDSIEIDGVVFYGGTMWTDFNQNNPTDIIRSLHGMNDYHHIRITEDGKERRLRPGDVYKDHLIFKDNLYKLRDSIGNKKLVVISHHLPSAKSVDPMFRNDPLASSYYSVMDLFIEEINPVIWIHGHTHHSVDYMIGNTNIVCNPLGYAHTKATTNQNFNPILVKEI